MEEYVGQEKGVETVGEDEGVQAEGASNAGPGGAGGHVHTAQFCCFESING